MKKSKLKTVIVHQDVFSDLDAEHPIASIIRVAGGRYRVRLDASDDSKPEEQSLFATIDKAMVFAEGIAALVAADPTLITPQAVHLHAELAAAKEALDAERKANEAMAAQLNRQIDDLKAKQESARPADAKA